MFKPKPYKTSEKEAALKTALRAWQNEECEKSSQFHDNEFFRPQLLMTDIVLQRIIDLAHYVKLPNISALAAQTHWHYTKQYSGALLAIINKYCPQTPSEANPGPPKQSATLQSMDMPLANPPNTGGLSPPDPSSASAGKSICRCKTCLSTSHIGESSNSRCLCQLLTMLVNLISASNLLCPLYSQRAAASSKTGHGTQEETDKENGASTSSGQNR